MHRKVAVFCGAHPGSEKIFSEHAYQVGKLLAQAQAELVFGGGNRGLMGTVSDAAIDHGGKVIGIALEALDAFEKTNPRVATEIVTKTFFERKEKFLEISDAFIVLPGGMGSLDELLDVQVNNQVGMIAKPIVILNTLNYYDHFIAWMKNAVKYRFLSDENSKQIIITSSPEDAVDKALNVNAPSKEEWMSRLKI
ncbi:MAG: TIGR00730 family Rossman fold protein [Gammaproteobacteria bacterium]